ncbi:MAG TPA: hypothetical protein PKC21_07365 [Oligoflexia bacterium]|nr:hypothetical protein [Oligoflexia bacterium]HMR25155.1 hypothetical protein [Oligoflexia bacterium]
MDKCIAIVGYGNQAKVWAQNLRDSTWQVTILLRKTSANWSKAINDGFVVEETSLAKNHPVLAILISDHAMLDFFANTVLSDGAKIIYAHGSTLLYHFDQLPKTISHLLLSPKMIADEVRECYQNNKALPCVLDVFHSSKPEEDLQFIKYLATALGCNGQEQMFYDVKTEVYADFFSEQTVLCGGVPKLLMQAIDTMVQNGIPEDLAYLECVKELEIFMRLFNEKGFYQTMQNISPSALYGSALYAQRQMPVKALQESFDQCMDDIQSGRFYQSLQKDSQKGLEASQSWKQEMKSSKFNCLSEGYIKKHDKE